MEFYIKIFIAFEKELAISQIRDIKLVNLLNFTMVQ